MATQPGDLLTIKQVAKLVGLRERAFYNREADTWEIPFIKMGRSYRYRQSDVEEWLERRTVRPTNLRAFGKRRA